MSTAWKRPKRFVGNGDDRTGNRDQDADELDQREMFSKKQGCKNGNDNGVVGNNDRCPAGRNQLQSIKKKCIVSKHAR